MGHEDRQDVSQLVREMDTLRGRMADLEQELRERMGGEDSLQADGGKQNGQEALRMFVEAADSGLLVVDRDTRTVLYANRAACSLFGRDEDELLGEVFGYPLFGDTLADIDLFREDEVLRAELRTLEMEWSGRSAWLVSVRDITARTLRALEEEVGRRRRAQEALRRSERKLASIIRSIPDVVYQLDPQGRFTFVNDAVENYGYSKDELLGRSVFDFIHPADRKRALFRINERRTGERRTKDLELRFLSKAEGAREFLVSMERTPVQPVFLVDAEGVYDSETPDPGTFLGTQGLARDVSHRKRAEAEAARALDRLRGFFDAIPGFVHVVDANYTVLDASQRFIQAIGLDDKTRIVGRKCYEAYRGRDSVCPRCTVQRVFETGTLQTRVSQEPDERFGALFTKSHAAPIHDAKGKLAGALELIIDISDLRQTERDLMHALELNLAMSRLSKLILESRSLEEVAPLVLDTARNLTESRFGFVGFIDPASGNLVCPTMTPEVWDTCGMTDKTAVFEVFSGLWGWVLENNAPVLTNAPAADPRSGGVPRGHIPVERFLAAPARDGEGRVVGLIALCNAPRDYGGEDRDILERLTDLYGLAIQRMFHERELMESKRQAEAANETKTHFLANMSHELRTPLNGVIGLTQLLLDTDCSEEQREYLELSRQSSESLLEIVNNLLELATLESDATTLEEREFSIGEVVAALVQSHAVQARKRGVTLEADIDDDVPRILLGDNLRLQQVAANLLSNALRHTNEGRVSLRVSLAEPPETRRLGEVVLRVEVADTGVGIPADKLEGIFKGFTLTEHYLTKRYSGTGLGLRICTRLVELLGGSIQVESQEGAGSTFSFTARFRQAEVVLEPAEEQYSRMLQDEEKTSLRILLAEDDPVNQSVVVRTLQRQGYDISAVNDGEELLKSLGTGSWDMLLMDIQMPRLDGLAATRVIRAGKTSAAPDIPIVALTAYVGEADKEQFLRSGMDEVVAKPFNLRELLDAVERQGLRAIKAR